MRISHLARNAQHNISTRYSRQQVGPTISQANKTDFIDVKAGYDGWGNRPASGGCNHDMARILPAGSGVFTGPGSNLLGGDRTAGISRDMLIANGMSRPVRGFLDTSNGGAVQLTPDFPLLNDSSQIDQMLGEMANFGIDNNVYNLFADTNSVTGSTVLMGFYTGPQTNTNINGGLGSNLPYYPAGSFAVAGIEIIIRVQTLNFMPLIANVWSADSLVPLTSSGATAVFAPRGNNAQMLQRGYPGSTFVTSMAPYVPATQPFIVGLNSTYSSFFFPFAKANVIGVDSTIGLARAGRVQGSILNSYFLPSVVTAENAAFAAGVAKDAQYFNFAIDVGVLAPGTTVGGNFRVATTQSQALGYLGML